MSEQLAEALSRDDDEDMWDIPDDEAIVSGGDLNDEDYLLAMQLQEVATLFPPPFSLVLLISII